MVDPDTLFHAPSGYVLGSVDGVYRVLEIVVRQARAVERFDLRFKTRVSDFLNASGSHDFEFFLMCALWSG